MFPTVDTEHISQNTSLLNEPGTSSDDQDSAENFQAAKQNNNRDITINMLVKEAIFCIALALTTLGALHNTPSKVSKVPQPIKFFNSALVTDWYKGQLSSALRVINTHDVSFVMYYAPWDGESQYVRGEFEKAAILLNDRVHFSAINCWNPGSECRMQHNKIASWPILIAYTVTSRGILYKGPRNAESMVNFLDLIIQPLQKVSSREDLVNLLSMCNAVAVGYTPLTDTSKFYNIWYNTALKIREFDTVGEVCFAVVTSLDLANFGIESAPNARFMLWNDTQQYITKDVQRAWNESSLVKWVLENFAQPVARIIPMWKKSFNFERYADGNPMLMLFTPMNPLYEQLPSYALMREIAMEYYNCQSNQAHQWTAEFLKVQQIRRLMYQQKKFMKFCQEYKFKKPSVKMNISKKEVVSNNNKYPWNNMTQKNQKSSPVNLIWKEGLGASKLIQNNAWSSLELMEKCSLVSLPVEKSNYDFYEKCASLEEQLHHHSYVEPEREKEETVILPVEDDPLSAENLIQDYAKYFCNKLQFANTIYPPVFPSQSENETDIRGLGCTTNFTMYMIAVDSIRNYHFAEALGIDIKKKKDMTAVVILDSKHESQYVLSEEYSARSVREFIYNFTRKSIRRTLRSHVESATHTHFYGDGGGAEGGAASDVTIADLTTRTFRRAVRKKDVLTLVAVCGGGCGALTSRALAEATRLLNACGVRAHAARVDAGRHDLPWHYTPTLYPTILVFPPNRNGELGSRAYPLKERISSSGLVALALRALGTPHHVRVRLAMCSRVRSIVEKKSCLKYIREHIASVIGRNLKYWQKARTVDLRNAVLKRLQHLNRVQLLLSVIHFGDLTVNNRKQKLLKNALDDLLTSWNIDGPRQRDASTVKTR
ncbi:thioredoxin domain-containing protein 11 [Leptidea sinapis]|uniref:Thioredoxin domain-containing protein n=1 Tax=Leptidea sinapis TaxID=189913 RepID=A0A5E4PR24_9NEOP|nr:thioredoxin domain-containing protein 11 [Leptidea sinapis]VVC87331.1 unnamed protein product [Leptidea sinapis]